MKYLSVLLLFAFLNTNKAISQIEILIKKHNIEKEKNKRFPEYNGLYLTVEYDFINNTRDTITIFDIGYSSKAEPIKKYYKLFSSKKPNYIIDLIASNNQKSNENKYILATESDEQGYKFLNKSSLVKILPNKKRKYFIIKKIPSIQSDSINIKAQIHYTTKVLDINSIKKSRTSLNEKWKRYQELDKENFADYKERNNYKNKCSQDSYENQKNSELCQVAKNYYKLSNKVKNINEQYPLLMELDSLNLKSELYEKTILNTYK